MNFIEFLYAPDLLLWGKLNSVFAFLFLLVVYFNEFYLNKKKSTNAVFSEKPPFCSRSIF